MATKASKLANYTLMTVHAHPDDESSKGPGTVAKYHDQGVKTVLICATGGEEGDILNHEMDTEYVRNHLGEVRLQELEAATKIIGYDEVVMLGYRDSGMAGAETNSNPDCFAMADKTEAVGKLVYEIRRTKPQVIVTYDEDQSGYPHPDHLQVHDISVVAFDMAGDKDKFPHLGEPFQPLKLYYSVWSKARIVQMHEKFIELGLESPFDERWFDRPSRDEFITTQINVSDYYEIRAGALRAHRTQIEEKSKFWFGIPEEEAKKIYPFDDYVLAKSLVGFPQELESDLFEGIR